MSEFPVVGAHCRLSGGLATGGVRHAIAVAAEAVQVFVSNPRSWTLAAGDPSQDAEFRRHMQADGTPVFVHAPYLINLGSPADETVRRSGASLAHSIARGRDIGAHGVVVHTGSAVATERYGTAMARVREHLLPILDMIPEDGPEVLLEPTAGQGRSLCATVGDLESYLRALDHHPRLGVCLDTCHLFAAGHDLAVPGGADATLARFEEVAGRDRLRLVHANDSADVCGSRRDRHASIGHGYLGEPAFAELLGNPVLRGVPVVVETPGGVDRHRRDVAALKRLRTSGSGPSRQPGVVS